MWRKLAELTQRDDYLLILDQVGIAVGARVMRKRPQAVVFLRRPAETTQSGQQAG